MAELDDEITVSNVLSYARACRDVQGTFEIMKKQEYDFLVVPSRGAAPIVDAARVHWTSRRERLDGPGEFHRMVDEFRTSALTRAFFMPFTADIAPDFEIESSGIRRYWCSTLAAMIRQSSDNRFVQFYDLIRERVCAPSAFPPVATMYEVNKPPFNAKFVFLDTVISGRAISEIIDGFKEAGLANFYIIAIIDENGALLRPEYRRRLQELESLDQATLIYMDRLFTEDRGPAVSGIWSVVFPELMQVALEEIPEFREMRAVGAGLYYWTPEGAPDVAARAIALRRQAIIGSMLLPSQSFLPQVLDEYVTELRKEKLFDPGTTVDIARPRIAAAVKYPHKLEASGSHVIRVHLDRDMAAKIVRDFLALHPVRINATEAR